MSVSTDIAAAGVAVISGVQPAAASFYTLSAGRIGASTAALVGLLGAVNGGLALARFTGLGHIGTWVRRNGAVTALVAGLIAVVAGGSVAVTADGGLGTGNGLGGAYVAMLAGVIAVGLGWLARSRRTGPPSRESADHSGTVA
jgi:hypothetical protein